MDDGEDLAMVYRPSSIIHRRERSDAVGRRSFLAALCADRIGRRCRARAARSRCVALATATDTIAADSRRERADEHRSVRAATGERERYVTTESARAACGGLWGRGSS